MTTIAQAEVESRINELIQRSANGETFEIVQDGRPVVRLSPANSPSTKKDPARARAAAEALIAMAGFGGRMTAEERKALIEEGRL